jgi:drug/metabolite transporter (DMT)-like permease
MVSDPRQRRAYFAWAAVCLVWGTTYLGIRIALETIPPLLMAAFRWIAAGAVLISALKIRGEHLPSRREYGSLAVLGFLLLGLGNGGVVWAEQTVPSGLTAVLVATAPFWMIGADAVRRDGDPLVPRRIVGLAIGFGGIVLLVWPELHMGAAGRPFLGGVIAAQIACIGWAIGSSYARRRGVGENVLAAAAFEMLFGGLLLLAVGLLRGEWGMLSFSARSGGALAYLIVFGAVVGFSAYVYALKHLPVAFVSLYAYINPLIAMVLGTVVLGEPLGPRTLIAAAVVLIGMWLVRDKAS